MRPSTQRNHRGIEGRGFTLTELLVTLAIIAILSAMMLGGLSQAGRSRKRDVTKFLVRKLSSAIMEAYEDFEDVAPAIRLAAGGGPPGLRAVRQRLREHFPDSWSDVAPGANVALTDIQTPVGRQYAIYKTTGSAPTTQYEAAECLYMIVTQSGGFSDLLAEIRPEQIGDVDGDGKREFLDAWGNPIAFLRWAPGYVYPPIQIPDPTNRHDPFDEPLVDGSAFALFPFIYSAGPDGFGLAGGGGPSPYGIIHSDGGWPNNSLNNICLFAPDGILVGSPDPDPSNTSAHLDNITNFNLMLE